MTVHRTRQARRVFRRQRPYALSEAVCNVALSQLTAAIGQRGAPSGIIGIASGGRHPAEKIADQLDVPLFHATARHNATDDLYVQATGRVEIHLPTDLPRLLSGRFVIVDDICGTGATLTALTDALTPRRAPGTRLEWATLCRNIGSPIAPHWWCWEVDEWTVFPWEPRPTMRTQALTVPEGVRTS
ncbi:phosphoribosyltransferase [Streptomyces sp. NPDC048172]|uniref:phosphoribosyltransferase n=1 Tax=Streptomyces sp. NPDC048172 TaxID=3365505 RepID=UPI00371D8628